MPTLWETFPVKFEGGLITNQGRLEQGINFPGSATTLQNFEADIRGGYTRILGYSKFSETEVPGTGVVKGVIPVGPSKVLAARDGAFQYSEGAGWTSKLTITSSVYEKISYDFYDFGTGVKYVVVDGVNTPAFYNVTANTMAYGVGFPADVVGASWVRVFKNHIFYAVGKNLVFSAPFTDNDFAPANGSGIINIGYEITGLMPFRDQLFIFCVNRIFRLSGNALGDFTVLPVTFDTGCIAGHTIQEVGGDIMYLSSDGVRYLSASERENDFGLTRASEKVQFELTDWLSLNGSYASLTISSKNQYRIFLYEGNVTAASSEGFIGVKFSNQTSDNISWSQTLGIKVYACAKYTQESEDEHYFSNDDGFVYRMESGSTFDGTAIPAIFETPYMPINDPKVRKTLYKHTLYTRGNASFPLTLRLLFDYNISGVINSPPFEISSIASLNLYGSATSIYGLSVYGGGSETQYYNNLVGSGFVVALRYECTEASTAFNLNFAVLEFKTNERR